MTTSLDYNNNGFININNFDSNNKGANIHCLNNNSKLSSPSYLLIINKEEDLENGPKQKGGLFIKQRI
jgi:hypothetical protein